MSSAAANYAPVVNSESKADQGNTVATAKQLVLFNPDDADVPKLT
jgi:hypothetical protein